jgi:hypothetical protein
MTQSCEIATVTRVGALIASGGGLLPRGTLATIVAEQLTDDEFERLEPREAQAAALRRLGFTHVEICEALGFGEDRLRTLLWKARKKDVTP